MFIALLTEKRNDAESQQKQQQQQQQQQRKVQVVFGFYCNYHLVNGTRFSTDAMYHWVDGVL